MHLKGLFFPKKDQHQNQIAPSWALAKSIQEKFGLKSLKVVKVKEQRAAAFRILFGPA